MTGYTIIWPLFGAANQLLAALALLAVCAWLGNAGRNNKMFYIPMVFMLVVTLTSLVMTLQAKCTALMAWRRRSVRRRRSGSTCRCALRNWLLLWLSKALRPSSASRRLLQNNDVKLGILGQVPFSRLNQRGLACDTDAQARPFLYALWLSRKNGTCPYIPRNFNCARMLRMGGRIRKAGFAP